MEKILARKFDSMAEVEAAVDSTSLSKYPWNEVASGMDWRAARYLLCAMIAASIQEDDVDEDDNTLLDYFLKAAPRIYAEMKFLTAHTNFEWNIPQGIEP